MLADISIYTINVDTMVVKKYQVFSTFTENFGFILASLLYSLTVLFPFIGIRFIFKFFIG